MKRSSVRSAGKLWCRQAQGAIIHRCRVCGALSSNRIAADDNPMKLMSLAMKPVSSPPFPLERIEEMTRIMGGDLYRVTAKDPYPDDYNQTADRAKQEQDNDERPEIMIDLTEEQMAQYDTVFFGFPVWWYDLPMPMWTFLESYDFSGKTIIPFFSHEGSSNGAGALPTIEKLTEGATVRSDDALSIRGEKVDGSENDVREWVKGLNY